VFLLENEGLDAWVSWEVLPKVLKSDIASDVVLNMDGALQGGVGGEEDGRFYLKQKGQISGSPGLPALKKHLQPVQKTSYGSPQGLVGGLCWNGGAGGCQRDKGD